MQATWGDMKAVTWGDVKHFTYEDLKTHSIDELMDMANSSLDSPHLSDKVKEDLRSVLCGIAASAVYDAAKSVDWHEVYARLILFLQSLID